MRVYLFSLHTAPFCNTAQQTDAIALIKDLSSAFFFLLNKKKAKVDSHSTPQIKTMVQYTLTHATGYEEFICMRIRMKSQQVYFD